MLSRGLSVPPAVVAAGDWRIIDGGGTTLASTRKLYYNSVTGVSTFEKPHELKTAQEKLRDQLLENGKAATEEAAWSFDRLDEEDKAARSGQLFRKNETFGYLDTESFLAASLDKPIPPDNRGFKLLKKLGWREGQGLGPDKSGIVAPIALNLGHTGLGLGKQQEYDRYTDEAAKERKKLDIELEETPEEARQREEKARKDEAIKQDVRDMNREFYCEECDKQYKTVAEMANHLSSYDHHHTKRMRETREAERARRGAGFNRTKEQKKEWEAMQRRMRAAGATIPAAMPRGLPPPSLGQPAGPSASPSPPPPLPPAAALPHYGGGFTPLAAPPLPAGPVEGAWTTAPPPPPPPYEAAELQDFFNEISGVPVPQGPAATPAAWGGPVATGPAAPRTPGPSAIAQPALEPDQEKKPVLKFGFSMKKAGGFRGF